MTFHFLPLQESVSCLGRDGSLGEKQAVCRTGCHVSERGFYPDVILCLLTPGLFLLVFPLNAFHFGFLTAIFPNLRNLSPALILPVLLSLFFNIDFLKE